MKKKLFYLLTTPFLLLTSCNEKIDKPEEVSYFITDFKYKKCRVSIKEYAYVEFHQYKYKRKEILDNDVINNNLELFKIVATSNFKYKDMENIDGFDGLDYLKFDFIGETTTSLYIRRDNKYKVGLEGYDNNNNLKFFMYDNLNEECAKIIDKVKPYLEESLESIEWIYD